MRTAFLENAGVARFPASTRRTRAERRCHSATRRSVGSAECSGLVVIPYAFGMIPAGDGAEAHEVEVGILGDQRIEGPFDQADPSRKGVFPLKQLQSPADAAIAVPVEHGRHVGVEKRLARAPSGNRQSESNQFAILKCAEDLPSRLRGDDKQRDGNDIDVGRLPDRALDSEAGFEIPRFRGRLEPESRSNFQARDCCLQDTVPPAAAISFFTPCLRIEVLDACFSSLPQYFEFFLI